MITGAMIAPTPMMTDPVPPQVRVAMEIEAGLRASMMHRLQMQHCSEDGEGWKKNGQELNDPLDKDVNATRKAALEVLLLYLSGEQKFELAPVPQLGANTVEGDTDDGEAPQPAKV